MDGVHTRTLERALEIAITKQRLATALKVSLDDLEKYLAGTELLPQHAFLDALDIVAAGHKSPRK